MFSTKSSLKRSKKIGTFRIYLLYSPIITEDSISSGYYIGYTGCKIEDRVKGHIQEAKFSKKGTKKLNWLRTLCPGLLKYMILEDDIQTEEEAMNREIYHIGVIKSSPIGKYLKNGDGGGNGKYRIHTPESRKDLANGKYGNKWNIGKKHSEETKNKISGANKGKVIDKESIEKSKETKRIRYEERVKNGNFISMRDRLFSEENVIEIFRLFNCENLSAGSIAEIFKCPVSTISTVLYHNNAYKDYKYKNRLVVEKKKTLTDKTKECINKRKNKKIDRLRKEREQRKIISEEKEQYRLNERVKNYKEMIRLRESGKTCNEIAILYNIDRRSVSRILRGGSWGVHMKNI